MLLKVFEVVRLDYDVMATVETANLLDFINFIKAGTCSCIMVNSCTAWHQQLPGYQMTELCVNNVKIFLMGPILDVLNN